MWRRHSFLLVRSHSQCRRRLSTGASRSPSHATPLDQPLTGAQWSAFFKANFNAFAIFGGVISGVALVVSYQNGVKADIKLLENNAKNDKELLENSIKAMNVSAELAALKNTLLLGQSEEYKAMREHTSRTSLQKTSD
jgi:hypothetical protein